MMLAFQHLCFERNDRILFRHMRCELAASDILQVCGANGSGKSTLLRILAGYIEPQEGTILWQNKNILEQRDHYQQQLHYVSHQNGLRPYLTAYENLQMHSALLNQSLNQKEILDILNVIGLSHARNKQITTLSAGQLRRLTLGRLLLRSAPLWILDEPTTALDKEGQQLFFHLLDQHRSTGGITVLTSHQQMEVNNIKTLYLGEKNG